MFVFFILLGSELHTRKSNLWEQMTFSIAAGGTFYLKAPYLTVFPLHELYLSDFPGERCTWSPLLP